MQFFAAFRSFEVYHDDLENSSVNTMFLNTSLDVLETQYHTQCTVLHSKDKKIVILNQAQFLFYMVLHDHKWSTQQCRQLLKLFHHCLQLKMNIHQQFKNINVNTFSLERCKQIMRPVVGYLKSHSRDLSILLSCLESIDLNYFNRMSIVECIEKKIQPYQQSIYHAILFIDNKCVALVSNVQQQQQQQMLLYPLDLLCLYIDLKSQSYKNNSTIFLQEKPCTLFVHSNSTYNSHLVFVCSQQQQIDFSSVANQIQDELVSFLPFLKIKAESHMTIQHYLHYCPGLVHFIFIDRIRHIMITPHFAPELEEPIFQMIQLTMEQHKNNSSHEWICISSSNSFQYCFQEWMQDENGNTLRMVPSNFKFCRSHFQFYAMYLPIVSTQAMAHYNRLLINLLWEDNFK